MTNAIAKYRPGLLGSGVFDDVFDNFFTDFPRHLRQSTSGYPVTDIYNDDNGNTVRREVTFNPCQTLSSL